MPVNRIHPQEFWMGLADQIPDEVRSIDASSLLALRPRLDFRECHPPDAW